jgi:hypothetical protein
MHDGDAGKKAFASQLKAASPSERGRLISSYRDWVRAGAAAQGIWAGGFVLLGVAAFAAVIGWFNGVRSLPYEAACAVAFLAGVLGSRVAMKRERRWRQANPWGRPESIR